jgi:hypothetical protein
MASFVKFFEVNASKSLLVLDWSIKLARYHEYRSLEQSKAELCVISENIWNSNDNLQVISKNKLILFPILRILFGRICRDDQMHEEPKLYF